MSLDRVVRAVLVGLFVVVGGGLLRSAGLAAQISVTPDGGMEPNRLIHTTGHTATFTVTRDPGSTLPGPIGFTCATASVVVSCTPPGGIVLMPGQSTNVTLTYAVGNFGTGSVTLRASSTDGVDDGFKTVPVIVPAGAPRLNPRIYLEAKQDYSRCAANCFAMSYAQSTVPYFSMDTPRNVTLVYHGDRVAPKPIVLVNIAPDSSFGTYPSEYQLQVKVNGALVTFLNGGAGQQTIYFTNPANKTYRIGGQFTPAGLAADSTYPMEILVTAKIGANLYTNRWITTYHHIDEATNPIARGWTVAGVQRAVITAGKGILIKEGDGSATYFKYNTTTFAYDAPDGDFSRLTASGGNWIRAYPDSTKVTFASTGRMSSIADRFGNTTTVTYDGSNRIWKLTDPASKVITLNYGANGLSSIVDPASRTTTVQVAAGTRVLDWIQDPDNLKTQFAYDGSTRLRQITDRRGKARGFAYDTQSGLILADTAALIPVSGGTTARPTTVYEPWQKRGVPYTATSTGSGMAPPVFDTVWARVTEPGGSAVTRFTVNRWGSPERSFNAVGDSTVIGYTIAGLVGRTYRQGYGAGEKDSVAYNGSGLPTYMLQAGSTATTITYGGWGQLTNSSGTGQPTVQSHLGTAGRIDSVRVGGIVTQRFTYDAKGRVTATKDAKNVTISTNAYDPSNFQNQTAVTLAGNRATTYQSDSYGRRFRTHTPHARPDTTTFDVLNRVTSVIRWADASTRTVTAYAYEDSLHLTKVTDAKSQVYSFLYNAVGWLIRETDPVGRRDTFAYAVNGDLLSSTNRNNKVVTYTYDLLHRPLSQVGSSTVNWAYANGGFRVIATSAQARDTIVLNARNQPTYVKTTFLTPGQTFDRRYYYTSAGLLDSVRVSGGGIGDFQKRTYGYDTSKGLLSSIQLGANTTSFLRDANFADTSVAFPGGGDAKTTWGSIHAPLKLTSSAAYSSNIERWIGLDTLGRVDKQLGWSGNGGRFYEYDWLGRLKQGAFKADTGNVAPPGPGCPEPGYGLVGTCFTPSHWATLGTPDTYTYDAAGNRTDKGGTYGTGNRIQVFDGCNYTTDSTGNVRTRTCGGTVTTYVWNFEGQLTSVSTTGQPTYAYYYDAQGRLARRDSAGVANRYFLWDGSNLFAELGANANTKISEYSFYPGLDNLHATILGATAYYAHRDGLGNVIQLSNGTTSQRTYEYTDWGGLGGGSDALPFAGKDRVRWKGALWMGPDANLYYMRNRWYDAASGRFLSEDPIGIVGGINRTAFASGDPVNRSDAFGLNDCKKKKAEDCPVVLPPVFADGGLDDDYQSGGLRQDFRSALAQIQSLMRPSNPMSPPPSGNEAGAGAPAPQEPSMTRQECSALAGEVVLGLTVDLATAGWGKVVVATAARGIAAGGWDAYVAARSFGVLFAGADNVVGVIQFNSALSSSSMLEAARAFPVVPFVGSIAGGMVYAKACI